MGWHNRMATRSLVPAAVGYGAPWGAASWRERGGMGPPFPLLGVGWGTETCVCYFRPRPESVYMDPSELHPGPKKRSPLNKYEWPKIALPEPVRETLTELNRSPSVEEEPIYEEVN
ncbi:unnamed protein product [Caretta caretta]